MTTKLKITNVKDAIELMEICGYPVKEVRWVTWGGGALQDFEDDKELIEFAEAMRKRIDENVEAIIRKKAAEKTVAKAIRKFGPALKKLGEE